MTVQLASRKKGNYTFVEFDHLGRKITLSKKLKEREQKAGHFQASGLWEIPADAFLCATQKGDYTNFMLTYTERPAESTEGADEDLPF